MVKEKINEMSYVNTRVLTIIDGDFLTRIVQVQQPDSGLWSDIKKFKPEVIKRPQRDDYMKGIHQMDFNIQLSRYCRALEKYIDETRSV